jgi:uncharacterized protein (TIGR00297 family)
MTERRSIATSLHSDTARQLIHMSMGLFALLLVVLTWWQAATLALGALLFNTFLLPRVGGRILYRPGDRARDYPMGIVFYPLAVLLLILAFPHRPDIAASAWAIMAFGDASAAMVGMRWGRRKLPWNTSKTVEGTLTFVLVGSVSGVLLAWWTRSAVSPPPAMAFVLVAPVVAAIAAAFVETVPVQLDDNISVPAVAAAVLWGLGLATEEAFAAAMPVVGSYVVPAVVVNVAAGVVGWWIGAVSRSGAVGGGLIGLVVYAGAGPAGWLLLFATLLAATIATRLGARRKAILGIEQESEGRRNAGSAIANCAVAAGAVVLAVITPHRDAALLAFVASLAAASSDTIASEVGKAWGRRTWLVSTLSQVRPGTAGGVTAEGTVAGVAGAVLLASLGAILGLIPVGLIWIAVLAAVIGSLLESALGATLEPPGLVNNHVLNFLNTSAAAILAVVLAPGF